MEDRKRKCGLRLGVGNPLIAAVLAGIMLLFF